MIVNVSFSTRSVSVNSSTSINYWIHETLYLCSINICLSNILCLKQLYISVGNLNNVTVVHGARDRQREVGSILLEHIVKKIRNNYTAFWENGQLTITDYSKCVSHTYNIDGTNCVKDFPCFWPCNSTGWLVISAVTYRRRHPDSRNEIVRDKESIWGWRLIQFQLKSCSSLRMDTKSGPQTCYYISFIFYVYCR